KAIYETISVKPTEFQKEMVKSLGERADKVRSQSVAPNVDNMLKITNDGRKLALDQRLINPLLPDDENSKVSICANKTFDIWNQTKEKRLAQMIFCDLSTPKSDEFNVYHDIKEKLIDKGIPKEEIAFIHDAKTELQKDALFAKVRNGEVRVLMGSTQKMGTGTNCQDRLIALHDLDCPWRPADLEQRSGRIIRQGNLNEEVQIYRYVTENTFDAYLWQLVENKQKFIGQIMTSKSPVRSAEDVDESALSYAEIKALATGNPLIKEKMDLDVQVAKLKVLKANFLSEKYRLEDKIAKFYPREIKSLEERSKNLDKDIQLRTEHTKLGMDGKKVFTPMEIKGHIIEDKELAGQKLLEMIKGKKDSQEETIGKYRGFEMNLSFDSFTKQYLISLKGHTKTTVAMGDDIFGNITRLDNALESLDKKRLDTQENIENTRSQLELAKKEVEKPFVSETELKEKQQRLSELEIILSHEDTLHVEESNPQLEEAIQKIRDFLEREYENEIPEEVFEDPSHIVLAKTMIDNKYELETVIDLKEPAFQQYINGELKYNEPYQSLTDLMTYQIEFLDYEVITTIEPETLEKLKTELDYDRDNDGVIDRYDADFRDSKVMTYGDLDERENARADNGSEKERPRESLLGRLQKMEHRSSREENEADKYNVMER
ncbi:MAG: helicase C-terminal domain-containing protein, partial [Tissierellia bacterium]|nr:helicase C-terminal domain-containing protein [Tissierellia bacterium]